MFWSDAKLVVWTNSTAMKQNPKAMIAVTPPHNPSRPSMRLVALQQATTRQTLKRQLRDHDYRWRATERPSRATV